MHREDACQLLCFPCSQKHAAPPYTAGCRFGRRLGQRTRAARIVLNDAARACKRPSGRTAIGWVKGLHAGAFAAGSHGSPGLECGSRTPVSVGIRNLGLWMPTGAVVRMEEEGLRYSATSSGSSRSGDAVLAGHTQGLVEVLAGSIAPVHRIGQQANEADDWVVGRLPVESRLTSLDALRDEDVARHGNSSVTVEMVSKRRSAWLCSTSQLTPMLASCRRSTVWRTAHA